ncbi:MAG: hypothetical protein QW597_07235 [Thermoplasmataceae archaeon]
MKETSKMIAIPVGKGHISVNRGGISKIDGNIILLESQIEKGPCNDQWCQIQKAVRIRSVLSVPAGDWKILASGRVTLVMGQDIYGSIDKGRQDVTIRVGRSGSLSAKGFAFIE